MKRYWKIISLCIMTMIVIGTFYIKSSLAEKDNIKIEFEKVSGNQDELKNLILYADYKAGDQFHSFQISNKETISVMSQSLIQEVIKNSIAPNLKKLVEEHKRFMRGKDLFSNKFYNDENILVYANIKGKNSYEAMKDFAFDIEVLDKKVDKTVSIELDVPEKEKYQWMDVVDVQFNAGKVKVFVRANGLDGGDNLNVYIFDLDEQKLVNYETILSAPSIKNGWSDLKIINDFYSTRPEKYLLIKLEAYKEQMIEGGETVQHNVEPKLVADEVIIYNVEKDQSKKITLPNDLKSSLDSATIFDSTLFIQNGLKISQYDIEKEEWGKEFSFDFLNMKEGKYPSYSKLIQGKLYKVHSDQNERTLFIGDLMTGKTLYEGKLNVKNKSEDQSNAQLFIYEIRYVQ